MPIPHFIAAPDSPPVAFHALFALCCEVLTHQRRRPCICSEVQRYFDGCQCGADDPDRDPSPAAPSQPRPKPAPAEAPLEREAA